MSKKPVISIVVTTYNHEKFIAQCLDNILNQKDCPEFEIVIGNDCSTDKTGEIIEKYAKNYNIIKVLPRQKNLRMQKNLQDCFKNCQGDYIAICEGDDYFTDIYNLKKRYEALEKDKNASMVFNDIYILDEKTNKKTPHAVWAKKDLGNKITVKNIINPFNIITNFSCCMYRKSTVEKIPETYYQPGNADWLFNLYALDMSYGIFLKEYLSVYRLHSTSVYSSSGKKNQAISILESGWKYNSIFQYKYSDDFRNYAVKRIKSAFNEIEEKNKLLEYEIENLKNSKDISVKEKIKYMQINALKRFEDNTVPFEYKNNIQKIFSVKNQISRGKKHKVITVGGIRFKIAITPHHTVALMTIHTLNRTERYGINVLAA